MTLLLTHWSYVFLALINPSKHSVGDDRFVNILQGYFTGTGAIIRLPQCQWSNPEEYEYMQITIIWIHQNRNYNHNKAKSNQAFTTCACFMGYVVCIEGLVQERRNSIANALELHLSCTNPSICSTKCVKFASCFTLMTFRYVNQA